MCGRSALGVRTAFHFFAVVLAFGNAVGLNAVCRRRAVFVDLTLDRRTTAVFVWVSDRTERTQTLKGAPGVVAPGARSARGRFAQIQHVAPEIRVSRETGLTITDLKT